jgi:hypothetical protein
MTTIRNTGAMEGYYNTNQNKAQGQNGVSRFVWQGREYVCGVNATTCVHDEIATAWLAADTKVKFVNRT